MSANVIAFAGRTANRTATLAARATSIASERHEHHDNIVSIAAWRGQSRPRRTPTGVFFTTGVLTTFGAIA